MTQPHDVAVGMERLLSVVQDLSMTRSLDQIQEIVRHAARELTGADGATFVLREDDKCFYADEDAIAPLWKGRRFPLSACISGWAMLNRQSVVIENIYRDPRIPIDAYRPTFVKSLVMVPIRTRQPIGAIGNYWAEPHCTSADEIKLLQALADSTSIAIENVTLLDHLRQAKETAEGACRLKDDFLATISHELRTPLIPIVGWSEMLLDTPNLPPVLGEAIQDIYANAQHQLRLVNDLLDMSQILSGTLSLQVAPSRIESIVEAASQAIAPAAKDKGVWIEQTAGADLGVLLIDPKRIQQVAAELLSNAVKFTPKGGTVRVLLERTDSKVLLTVTDDGQGIPSEFLPHVFDHFRQGDGTMSRAAGGMGLGLAIVRYLVERHGGRVSAQSLGKGMGATFTVGLPLSATSNQAA